MSSFDHLKTTYFDECVELVEAAYAHLMAIQEERADEDTVHAIFRAFHSIKGGGGAFGFDRLVAFAHELEAVLDLLRDGRMALAPPIADLLLRSTDMLSDLIAATRAGEDKPAGFEDELLRALRAVVIASKTPAAEAATAPQVTNAQQNQNATEGAKPCHYRICFIPHPGLFKSANDPLLIIRQLMRIG